MISPAHRMERMQTHFFASIDKRVQALIAQGCDIIRLDVGSPDLPPHPDIVHALTRSANSPGKHGYQSHRGTPALKAAWCAMYHTVYGVDLDPDREIAPLIGSKEGIFNLMMALIEPGDIVLMPDPGYVTYARGTQFAGGDLFLLPLKPDNHFLPDLDAIPPDILGKAKILWLNYPNNPTAATASIDFFDKVITFCRKHQIVVCHDAAYTQVTFDGYRAPSILQVPGAQEAAVEFNTLSKSHNMAGWRVAAILGNASLVQTLLTLKSNIDSSHFLPIMEAAVQAMTGDQIWLRERNKIYQQRRDRAMSGLIRSGFQAEVPEASLYVWAKIPAAWSSVELAESLLENAWVSLTPGPVFGENGEGYLRFSLTVPLERIDEAMRRIERWMVDGDKISHSR